MGGLASIQSIRELDDRLQSEDSAAELEKLSGQLHTLHGKMLAMPREFLLVSEARVQEQVQACLQQHWRGSDEQVDTRLNLPSAWTGVEQVKEMWLCNTQVNFCAKAYPAVDVEHPDAPALTVLGGFFKKWLLA